MRIMILTLEIVHVNSNEYRKLFVHWVNKKETCFIFEIKL